MFRRLVLLLNTEAARRQMFLTIGVPKFPNNHRKAPALESLFNKVVDLKNCNFIKKRLQHSCFPVNITKFL